MLTSHCMVLKTYTKLCQLLGGLGSGNAAGGNAATGNTGAAV